MSCFIVKFGIGVTFVQDYNFKKGQVYIRSHVSNNSDDNNKKKKDNISNTDNVCYLLLLQLSCHLLSCCLQGACLHCSTRL